MGEQNPELKLFLDTARQLLTESGPRTLHSSDLPFDRAWWTRAADLGATALLAQEEYGGGSITGNGVADLVVLAQEFGRHAAPGPLLPVSTVLAGLTSSADPDTHRDTIENLVAGKQIATWAYSGDGGPGALAPSFVATRTDDGYSVSGVAERVEAAAQCDLLLVPATTATGAVQLLVSPDAAGVSLTRVRCIDLVRQYATVRLDKVQVLAAAEVGSAAEATARQWQIAVLLRCAETVGVLSRAFELTKAWAFERYSFGRPLASYQALKHRYATMLMWLQACQATTDAAAVAVANHDRNATVLLSVAKAYVGEHSVAMLQDCIQLHGGIGVTWEHDLHLYLRRAALNANTFGTPDDHYLWLADQQQEQAR